MFPGYYRPSEEELITLWNTGIFVFDTNVLLNIYSYPEDVRNVFLSVLKKIEDRIWIPYQVGLEFHRNRFSRIKQANQRVEKLLQTIRGTSEQLNLEVKSVELEKRNIGISNIQDRLTAVQEAHKALSDAVQLACDKLPPVSLDDSIGTEISTLLNNCVGSPPISQEALDQLLADAQDRYDKKIPPGFADENKGEEIHRDRSLSYPRKFGDLILWRQLLAHASENQLKSVVFVTGDKKKDWWWFDDNKTLGPLPELVQEITMQAKVELFWMYSADQFLQHAENYLKATEVTEDAVQQVKEFSSKEAVNIARLLSIWGEEHQNLGLGELYELAAGHPTKSFSTLADLMRPTNQSRTLADLMNPSNQGLSYSNGLEVQEAVARWLSRLYPSGEIIRTKTFPDLIVDQGEYVSGYEIKFLRNFTPRSFPPNVVSALLRGYLEVNEGRLNDFSLVLILPIDEMDFFGDQDWVKEVMQRGKNILSKYPAKSIIFGTARNEQFEPLLVVHHLE